MHTLRLCFAFLILASFQLTAISIETQEVILSGECEPLVTVDGCVSVASGHFFQVDHDLHGNTIDPINLTRVYDSHSKQESFLGMGFGYQFPLFASGTEDGARHTYALISERDGFMIPYQSYSSAKTATYCKVDPRVFQKGYTNVGHGRLSARDNFTNWKAALAGNTSNKQWTVQCGDGTKRSYSQKVELHSYMRKDMGLPTKTLYLLSEEAKPNGNKLVFSYQTIKDKPLLSKICTVGRTGQVLNQIDIAYSKEECILTSSCGKKVKFSHESRRCYDPQVEERLLRKFVNGVHSSENGKATYHRDSTRLKKIERIEKLHGRCLDIHYNDDGQVENLKAPLGPKGEMVFSYRFTYSKNATQVLNALDQATSYTFDNCKRLHSIIEWDNNYKEFCTKSFVWSHDPGQEGWLKSKSIGVNKQLYYEKKFEYDTRGNVKTETLVGNLTGEQPETFTAGQQTDEYALSFTYYEDERNLLASEATPQGLNTYYEYLPGTNLCTAKFCHYDGIIQERLFTHYDGNGQPSLIIEDDGSSNKEDNLTNVTYRRSKVIYPVNAPGAAFGKPDKIEEYYLDGTSKTLLRTTHFAYNTNGKEISAKVYDSQHVFCYETKKDYNHRQHLASETNALGQETLYEYDHHNNKIREELVGSDKVTTFTPDLANRIRVKTEHNKNGPYLVTTYAYDEMSRKIAETDSFGQKTIFSYDRLGYLSQIIKPVMQDDAGNIFSPVVKKKHNILGQLISETDENDQTTTYAYTVTGGVTRTTHPDGSVESAIYYPCGWLKQKWEADGASTQYTYDPKGRLLTKTYLDTQGQVLTEESNRYKGELLIWQKDAQGQVTTFRHDGAGRKIEEACGEKITHYTYDDLSRVIQTTCVLENDAQIERLEYDWLDRVTSKTLEDENGHIFSKEEYAYDLLGNRIQLTIWISSTEKAIYQARYDSAGQLLWKQDPHGFKTTWNYDHKAFNTLGQTVLERTHTDPLGVQTVELCDSFQRVVSKKSFKDGTLLSATTYAYDAKGQLKRERSSVLAADTYVRDFEVVRTYKPCGYLASETELPSGKTTSMEYDPCGRLFQKTKPDGVVITYTYDHAGRLAHKAASDDSIAFNYKYDTYDNLILAEDLLHQGTLTRTYDTFNRIKTEDTAAGHLQYAYDACDRLVKLTLPDNSYVTYIYDPYHLKTLTRYNADNQLQYTCSCDTYDWRGLLLKQSTLAGVEARTYDSIGRLKRVQTPQWNLTLDDYDAKGNLLAQTLTDPDGIHSGVYTYDGLDNLTSESLAEDNHFTYDSLRNCVSKNQKNRHINHENQLVDDGDTTYIYDDNGNLLTDGSTTYAYNALNQLTLVIKDSQATSFTYDGLGRCVAIGSKHLLYFDEQELGSTENGIVQEFRLAHPNANEEKTFAIELADRPYFTTQDAANNISALYSGNSLVQWERFSTFGNKTTHILSSPWGYANRRLVGDLVLYTHRFYSPALMRWLTTDPIGYEDSLNLYQYVYNNPFCYRDPDGCFVFLAAPLFIPLCGGTFGAVAAAFEIACVWVTLETVAVAVTTVAFAQALHTVDQYLQENCTPSSSSSGDVTGTGNGTPTNSGGENDNKPSIGLGPILAGATGAAYDTAKRIRRWYNEASKATQCVNTLSKAGQKMDRGGLTKAGRGLDKHGNRPGSIFPKATGNTASKNQQGQYHLDDILTHPYSQTKPNKFGGFDIRKPDGAGARYYNENNFRGFLEP